MFEDKELVEIFRTESQERLQSLDQGLLRLEANPQDAAALEEVFRDAHNLKGAARMIGAEAVGTVAHRFEDLLGEARRGELLLTPERIDGLYYGIDAMRRLVTEAVDGIAAGIDLPTVLAVLNTEQPVPRATAPAPAPEPELPAPDSTEAAGNGTEAHREVPAHAYANGRPLEASSVPTNGTAYAPEPLGREPEAPPPPEPPASDPSPKPAAVVEDAQGFRIETIRVDPQKLDNLMTHAGELTVTKSRIARRLAEMDDLIGLQEEWSRDLYRAGRYRANGHKSLAPAATTTDRERLERLGQLLADLKSAAAEDLARLEFVSDQLEQGIRSVRLLPLSTLFNLFPRMVRDLAREQGKEIQLAIEGGEITADKRILEEIKDPLMHMLRNAVDHGIESPEERRRTGKAAAARLRIQARQTGSHIVIDVEDDGRGIDVEAVRRTALRRRVRTEEELAVMEPAEIRELIFAPGFSTRTVVTDVSGRGVGLDVVRKNVEHLKGTIEVASETGRGCRIRLVLPITVATTRVLILSAAGQTFALPIEHVESARRVSPAEIFPIKGSDSTLIDGAPVTVVPLAKLLNLPEPPRGREASPQFLPCILLRLGNDVLGVLVDELLDEQEIVVKPLGALLKRVPNVAGATILGTGEVCVVLNAADLLKTARQRTAGGALTRKPVAVERKQVILLVEDSITTRAQEKRILEGAGYEVVTAVDGLDGFQKLGTRPFDAVISDVEMPNMDGLALTERIRQAGPYRELPIVLVTSLASDEHRRRGMDAGADAYLVKAMFDQAELLETLRRLL